MTIYLKIFKWLKELQIKNDLLLARRIWIPFRGTLELKDSILPICFMLLVFDFKTLFHRFYFCVSGILDLNSAVEWVNASGFLKAIECNVRFLLNAFLGNIFYRINKNKLLFCLNGLFSNKKVLSCNIGWNGTSGQNTW